MRFVRNCRRVAEPRAAADTGVNTGRGRIPTRFLACIDASIGNPSLGASLDLHVPEPRCGGKARMCTQVRRRGQASTLTLKVAFSAKVLDSGNPSQRAK